MTRRVFALGGAQVPLQLLLFLLILVGSLPRTLVEAFPASAILLTDIANNGNLSASIKETSSSPADTGEATEYPVFVSENEQETQTSPSNWSSGSVAESEVVTESFLVIEEQEVDEDGNQDYVGGAGEDGPSSTESPAILRSTLPMQPPKSSPEQEEVLRELKKLWDLSEGLSNTGNESALKTSLSSIVHLAYARVYIEPDETLFKLKHLLRELQARILGTESNHDENVSTTEAAKLLSSSSSSLSPLLSSPSTESNHFGTTITTSSPTNLMTATTSTSNNSLNNSTDSEIKRSKRSYFDDFDEIENIFFANVNSEENSLIPDEKNYYQLQIRNQSSSNSKNSPFVEKHNIIYMNPHEKNNTMINMSDEDPLDRTILSVSSSSSTVMSISTVPPTTPSPATVVQKVIHINDRQKPSSPFFLTPERIKELKSRMTSTSTTSTLSPIALIIDDDLENEVNSLQQHENVENFDIQISESASLTTTISPPPLSSLEKIRTTRKPKPSKPTSTATTTESPFTAEEIAVALFQLLRPEASHENDEDSDSDEDESGPAQPPHPTPSSILYQVGSLSSILNFTVSKNDSAEGTTTLSPPTAVGTVTKVKVNKSKIKNATLLAPPAAFSNLGYILSTSTSTERLGKPEQDIYDYTDVIEPEPPYPMVPPTFLDSTKDGIQNAIDSVARLSVGAKLVLLFSVFISILSIGFGLYALGPPLAGVGVLGIVIPIGLLLLFETSASGAGKNRKLTRKRQQKLVQRIQSEEFSKVLDMIFDAVLKYSKG